MRGFKPGRMSPELRHALGIPENAPPPWLINMQRYGPPPAYPNLKIPGVNAPLPEAITYGFGRLFTDEKGFTVYADPHGLNKAVYQKRQNRKPYWGAIKERADDDEEEFEEEEEEEEDEDSPREEGIGRSQLGMDIRGGESYEELKSGIQNMIPGGQTPEVDIKKPHAPPLPSEPKPLYQILEEIHSSIKGNEIVSSSHAYKISNQDEEQEVNIQKQGAANPSKATDKEEEKKKKEKEKAKYKNFKF